MMEVDPVSGERWDFTKAEMRKRARELVERDKMGAHWLSPMYDFFPKSWHLIGETWMMGRRGGGWHGGKSQQIQIKIPSW